MTSAGLAGQQDMRQRPSLTLPLPGRNLPGSLGDGLSIPGRGEKCKRHDAPVWGCTPESSQTTSNAAIRPNRYIASLACCSRSIESLRLHQFSAGQRFAEGSNVGRKPSCCCVKVVMTCQTSGVLGLTS